MGENAKFVLVTGGASYIGSHMVLELLREDRYVPVVVDNLKNSHPECLKRIEKLSGKEVIFYPLDLMDKEKLKEVFQKYSFHAVIHFAGLKAVGESVQEPLKYYRINIDIALNLVEVMTEFGVTNLLFSSSATVYQGVCNCRQYCFCLVIYIGLISALLNVHYQMFHYNTHPPFLHSSPSTLHPPPSHHPPPSLLPPLYKCSDGPASFCCCYIYTACMHVTFEL